MPRPTSTHEQREACKLLASQVGVRESARQLGLSESRVMQWSARYNWNLTDQNHVHNGPSVVQDCKQIVSDASNVLLNYGKTTKLHLAVAADKASERFEEMPADRIIDRADKLVAVTKVAATIHGWQDSQATSALNLNVLSGGRAIVQVNESKGSDSPTVEEQP